ncbi:hypothetical protein FV226_26700 [Methylobacterium sp. WL12]|uniref:hypothetical protein n=1 Tax=Methylobacterium sp. WL12 TaxID=2603890 RepID=UPI0011CAFD30|nr:hypothetical protein [Methylobacterium sp. WL12]TXM64285.1 hypothetical protein FV226_26700 [Methylobacterium sp. WL12]
MTERPFTFAACPDAGACRSGIRPLLAPGMDWSEVQCGRCGQAGIVRHADLVDAPAPAEVAPSTIPTPAPELEPAPEPEADEVAAPSTKGSGR